METTIGPWQISVQRRQPTAHQLAGKYDAAAANWHRRIAQLGYLSAYRDLMTTLQQDGLLAALPDKVSALDCGIGTAAFSLALAQTLTRPVEVSGIDLSPEMVRQADNVLRQAGVPATVRQGEVGDMPFEDGAFDLVAAAHTLEHLPEPLVGLREMVRVLRPGGLLILSVTQPGVLGVWLQWRWGNHTFSPALLTQLLAAAGLTRLRVCPFRTGLARWSSLAYVGSKTDEPAAAPQSRTAAQPRTMSQVVALAG